MGPNARPIKRISEATPPKAIDIAPVKLEVSWDIPLSPESNPDLLRLTTACNVAATGLPFALFYFVLQQFYNCLIFFCWSLAFDSLVLHDSRRGKHPRYNIEPHIQPRGYLAWTPTERGHHCIYVDVGPVQSFGPLSIVGAPDSDDSLLSERIFSCILPDIFFISEIGIPSAICKEAISS